MIRKFTIIFCLSLIALFLAIKNVHSAINSDFTPKWKVGDSWETVIRTMSASIPASLETIEAGGYIEHPGEPEYIHFEVIDLKEIDGEMCYIIEVTYDNPTNEYDRNAVLHLYIRKDSFTLKKILEIVKQLDGTTYINNFHDNDRDFVVFDMPFNISIPCDFPNFPATNTDEERTIKVPSGLTVTQKVIFIDANTAKIELSTKFGTRSIKTTQIWERGKPCGLPAKGNLLTRTTKPAK